MTDGLWQFVCASCGHVEMYLLDEQALQRRLDPNGVFLNDYLRPILS